MRRDDGFENELVEGGAVGGFDGEEGGCEEGEGGRGEAEDGLCVFVVELVDVDVAIVVGYGGELWCVSLCERVGG